MDCLRASQRRYQALVDTPEAGDRHVLAELDGPGCIRYLTVVPFPYTPADAEEWINYHTLFRRLLAMPKVAGFPGKVYLLLYSCRSGR